MTPTDLMPVITELLIAVTLGLLGSVTRIFIQYKRDGELPITGLGLYTEAFLGCIGGFLSWLFVAPSDLRSVAIVAITAGYSASDAIENWLDDGKPDG